MDRVYIRQLQPSDANISYKWRNDADIWEFTGQRPNKIITPEIETDWISKVLRNNNERRFAICLKDKDQYIGNVQLTQIENDKAEYHIFIGDKSCWGKGYAKEATLAILEYAFNELSLTQVFLEVNQKNIGARKLYQGVGFKEMDLLPKSDGFIVMMIQLPLSK